MTTDNGNAKAMPLTMVDFNDFFAIFILLIGTIPNWARPSAFL